MSEILVSTVLGNLEQMQYAGKPLVAKDQLRIRLFELTEERPVPLVVFNCLDFSWKPSEKSCYPQSLVSCDPKSSICGYYEDYIGIINLELETLGKPDLRIIIPDSELLDERVFSFAQSRDERLYLAMNFRSRLMIELAGLDNPYTPVSLWGEYCEEQGLRTPLDFTYKNYQRIQNEPPLQKKVRDQVKDSRKYFERNGISIKGVNEDEIYDRTAWYLAMYMGEGQALRESRAIVINLEDGRVPAWFQRGADGMLPILNPVNPNEFYNWRRSIRE